MDALVNHNSEEIGVDIPPKGNHLFGVARYFHYLVYN